MENLSALENTSSISCKCCMTAVKGMDTTCSWCGFPLKGTPEEQGKFIGRYIKAKGGPHKFNKQVKNARRTLGTVAVLIVLTSTFYFAMNARLSSLTFTVYMVAAAIFGFLAWWSSKNAFGAILTGLVLYISLLIWAELQTL